MAYNPTVNDNSGQILGEAQRLAKELRAKEQQQMWQGISNGVSNAASGLGEALDEVKANAIKYDTAAGMMDAYKQNAGALGLDIAALDGGAQKHAKNPDKLLGYLTVMGKMAENNMAVQRQQAQYTGALELARQKQALGLGGGGSTPMYGVEIADGVDIYR